jgi:hypothetical protein
MSENAIYQVSILVVLLGLVAVAAIVYFGLVLTRRWFLEGVPEPDFMNWLQNPLAPDPPREEILRYLAEAYAEHLQRRNEFWTSYGQVVIAALIIVVLSILLLTKTISAEAGLPILSGVSGFAIAKGGAAGRGISLSPGRPGSSNR